MPKNTKGGNNAKKQARKRIFTEIEVKILRIPQLENDEEIAIIIKNYGDRRFGLKIKNNEEIRCRFGKKFVKTISLNSLVLIGNNGNYTKKDYQLLEIYDEEEIKKLLDITKFNSIIKVLYSYKSDEVSKTCNTDDFSFDYSDSDINSIDTNKKISSTSMNNSKFILNPILENNPSEISLDLPENDIIDFDDI